VNLLITPSRVALGLGVLSASCVIAACGSSSGGSTATNVASGSSTTAATSGGSRFDPTAFRTCLKKHGVTLPSRPADAGTGTPAGGSFSGGPPNGGGSSANGFASNPKLKAAFQACGGGNFRPGASGGTRLSHTAIDNFVACVRKNGYPQMPNANFSGKGSIFPRDIESNAKFKAASRTCASVLAPTGTPSAGASTRSSA
jgi:hypothetical protein